jgi:hypothetical protein
MVTILNLDGLERAARNAGICAVVSKGECWNLLRSIEIAVEHSQPPIPKRHRLPHIRNCPKIGLHGLYLDAIIQMIVLSLAFPHASVCRRLFRICFGLR